MVLNTALSFVLAAFALLAPHRDPALYRRATIFYGSALGLLAALVLAEHIFHVDLGVDWTRLHAWLPDSNRNPGRMSAATAAAFLMTGAALILATRAHNRWMGTAVRVLTLLVGAIGVLGLIGHIVQAELLFPQYWFAPLALHTAGGFVLLCIALWLRWQRFDWGRQAHFARDDDRIAFVGAIVLVATALGAAIGTFAVVQGRVERLVREELLNSVSRRTALMPELIQIGETTARIAATRPAAIRNVRAIHAGRDDGSNIANVKAVVQSFLEQGVRGIVYYDVDGKVVARGGALATTPAITVALATPGKAELLWDQGFLLRHRLPLQDAAGRAGDVLLEQPLPMLAQLMERPSGRTESWESGLCLRREGELVCFPTRFTKKVFSTPLLNSAGERLPMTRAVSGETGTIITADYRSQSVVAAYGPVGDLGLGMVLKMDAAEIFQPIREQLQLALGVLFVIVAGGTVLLRSRVRPLATKLVDAEKRYRTLTDAATDAIVSADSRGTIVYFNPAAEQIFGYAAKEVAGEPLTILMPASYRSAHERGFARFLATGKGEALGKTLELAARRKDGSEFPIEISLSAWSAAGEQFFTAILRDITSRKEAAEALRRLNEELESRVAQRTAELRAALEEMGRSERHYRMLFDANPHPMWVYDPEALNFLAANNAAAQHYGYTREEFLRISLDDIRPPEDRAGVHTLVRQLGGGASHRGIYRHVKKDGAVIDVEVISDGIEFAGRKARLVLAHDITDRKRAEDEIRRLNAHLEERVRQRTAELEAVNRELEAFSYSVSHDLRAPLRHIGGFAQLLGEESSSALNESAKRYLSIIIDSVTQMGRLIDDLLSFSRMGRAEMHHDRVSMSALVAEVRQQLAKETDGRNIAWDIGPLPEVEGDRSMLRQVWVNLISNALKYSRPREQAQIGIACAEKNGELEFYVRDNGAGFDMEYAGKLFGVFQRLHRADEFEGTGVGLANVQRIISRHGGRTRAQGKVNEGATFYFTLPRPQRSGS